MVFYYVINYQSDRTNLIIFQSVINRITIIVLLQFRSILELMFNIQTYMASSPLDLVSIENGEFFCEVLVKFVAEKVLHGFAVKGED